MATYEEIYGKRVKEFDSDPTLDSSYEGQVWYDKSSGVLKSVVSAAAWASSSSMVNGRPQCSGTGTITAGLAAGTYPPAVGSYGGANQTEEYNGNGWSTGGDMSNGKADLNTFGTQTAAYAAGGDAHPTNPRGSTQVESYNGTSWTSAPSLPQGSYEGGGSASNGTATSALVLGGRSGPPSAITNVTQTWNGSSWGTGGTYPSTIQGSFVFGESTPTMISAGGYNGTAVQANAFSYDGSSWTAINSMQDGRYVGVGSGTNTSGLLYGGASGSPDTRRQTETFDGTTFSVGVLMASPRNSMAGSKIGGTTAFAASTPGVTEEYQVSINTITAAAWASTPSLGTARRQVGGFGHTTTTAVCACGQNPPALSNVEEYDGSSWSEVNNIPVARVKPFASGTLTAGLVGGGESGPSPASQASAAEYDGTNWTATPAIPQACLDPTSLGTQTASLVCVGPPSPDTAVLYYNGSSWTSGPAATPVKMASASGNGTQTEALVYGSSPNQTTTLEWDGSSWTSGGALLTGRDRGAEGVGAPQNAALYFGGNNPSTTELTLTEGYDGTSWSTRPNMATGRRGLGGAGTQTAALAFAGYTGSDSSASEEFTGVTETISASTLTTS